MIKKINKSYQMFVNQDLKRQKSDLTQAIEVFLYDLSLAIQNCHAQMDEFTPQITKESLLFCIESIQKNKNDHCISSDGVAIVIAQLNEAQTELGNRFRDLVECLATHRIHFVGSSKINWFGRTNYTDGIKDFLKQINQLEWNQKSQQNIAHLIYEQKFGTHISVLKRLAQFIEKIEWSDSEAQVFIARSICEQKFGTDPEVLTELARFIGQIKWEDAAQDHLATAIFWKKFGEDVPDELIDSYSRINWNPAHRAMLSFFESRYWTKIQEHRRKL